MVERKIDKDIRLIKEILDSPNLSERERLDKERNVRETVDTIIIETNDYSSKNTVDRLETMRLIEVALKQEDILERCIFEIYVKDRLGLKNLLESYKRIDPKRKIPIIKTQAIELISKEIGDLKTGERLVKFLEDCGVDRELIVYPNTKWRMISDVLEYLSGSEIEEDKRLLFKIIEDACHPLMFDGDKTKAQDMQDNFSNLLEFNGLCLENGKVVESNETLLKKIQERQRGREWEKETRRQLLGKIVDNEFTPPYLRNQEPPIQKIEITNLPELRIKGLEEKVFIPKPKDKKIQLRNFPKDLRWEEITIQFINGQEVIIKYRDQVFQTTYELMGFQNYKNRKPNKQWEFLRMLSELNGEISWKNPTATPKGKKQKQLLSDSLMAYFQITNDEPFFNYKKNRAYKIKINLVSETT